MLVFNPTVKKGETRKFISFYRGPYIIVEIKNDLNFKVEDKKTRKAIKVHYDRLKKYKTREKPFTPEPKAKRKTTSKEQKNSNLNSSDDGDIIEIESSTDSESNLITENQSEAEDASDSLQMKRLRMKLKHQSKKPLKGKRRHKMFPRVEVQLHRKLPSTLKKKSAETKIPKPEKKQQESSSKKKVLKKRLIVMPGHQKWLQGLAVD